MNWDEFIEEYENHPGYTEQLEPRVLRARWSQELAADLNSVHGIDAEEALGEIITEEIANELNLDPIVIPMIRRVMPQLMAQEIAEDLVNCGVKAIWNFTSTILDLPEEVVVQNTSLSTNVAVLLRHLNDSEN